MKKTHEQTLLGIYQKHGSLTDPEAAKLAKIPENCVRPARQRMERRGIIRRTNEVKDQKGNILNCDQFRMRGHHRIYTLTKAKPKNTKVASVIVVEANTLITISQQLKQVHDSISNLINALEERNGK
jgi:chaperonin GroEL (HSP60 family)